MPVAPLSVSQQDLRGTPFVAAAANSGSDAAWRIRYREDQYVSGA
jgi:hypothetical protein